MGLLSPLFIAAGASIAVPLLLHFLQRHHGPRVAFPALRYLRRAEEKHAFRIRLRQLLLLALRVLALLALVGAGARPYLAGRGESHEPTALAIVLDNSMSTGVVEGDVRLYDRLAALARASARAAGPQDRVWVLRAAEPWDIAAPGGSAEAEERIGGTEVAALRADLAEQLGRARALVRAAGLPAAEVHLLSDFQRTALPERPPAPEDDARIIAYLPPAGSPPNRAVTGVTVAAGLVPRANERSSVAATITAYGGLTAESTMVRLAVREQVRAARLAPAGESVELPLPPLSAGPADGFVEIDADGLRADDRRFFAFAVRPPPRVAVLGDGGPFLAEALRVLAGSRQLVESGPAGADVVFAAGDLGPSALRRGTAVVVIPPLDATRLPALNRRLRQARIPWQYALAADAPASRLAGTSAPEELRGIAVHRYYRLQRASGPVTGGALAHLANGSPWLVEGATEHGTSLLLASPLVPEATDLPVTARMVPVVDWMANRWAARILAPAEIATGQPIPVPPGATAIAAPDGTLHRLSGTEVPRAAPAAGIYRVMAGDSVAAVIAANVPPAESKLERLTEDELSEWLGKSGSIVTDTAGWRRAIFVQSGQLEIWRPLVAAGLMLLLVELWAAGAPRRSDRPTHAPTSPAGDLA